MHIVEYIFSPYKLFILIISIRSRCLSLGEDLLDLSNGLCQDLFLELRVTNLLVDLVQNRLDQLLLLQLSLLLLKSNPRVQSSLGLVSNSKLLLQLESLGFQLSGFSRNFKQLLGGGNNILQLRNRLNSVLDSRNVLASRAVQEVVHLLDLAISPLSVQWSNELGAQSSESGKCTDQDGFVMDDKQLVRNTVNGSSGRCSQDAGLRNETVTWQGIDDRVSLFLWLNWGGQETNTNSE